MTGLAQPAATAQCYNAGPRAKPRFSIRGNDREQLMWTAERAAKLWLGAHSIEEASQLLREYEVMPVLPHALMKWLAHRTADVGEPIMPQFTTGKDEKDAKTLARFEDAFIAN